jgi:hypothetical protein
MDWHVYTFLSSSDIFSSTLPTSTQNLKKISSLARPQPPAILWSPLPEQCSLRIKSNFWTLTLSSPLRPLSLSPHVFLSSSNLFFKIRASFALSLASFTSLRPSLLFPSSSPQQHINVTPSPFIIRATFFLYFPSHTAREQHFPCIPCMISTNHLPKW